MTSEQYDQMRRTPLDDLATTHSMIADAEALFDEFKSFEGARWAFRGQRQDWKLTATIERYSCNPGIAEDYAMREFRRRIQHYSPNAPRQDDDLEWLALMQHHGPPTRLLDWTRSAQVADFFAAESSVSASPLVRKQADLPPLIIWAIDTVRINAEAKAMLKLHEEADISAPETFRQIFWSQPAKDDYLVAAIEPHVLNERLAIQQGLFLLANHALFPFHNCLARLMCHANSNNRPSRQWLHRIIVNPKHGQTYSEISKK